jgi:electron transfer flavoprotein alpha/beta subunit
MKEIAIRGVRFNVPKQSESNELVSVDEIIDAIAREALEEARRIEEAERYRNNPGPVVPPHTPLVAP